MDAYTRDDSADLENKRDALKGSIGYLYHVPVKCKCGKKGEKMAVRDRGWALAHPGERREARGYGEVPLALQARGERLWAIGEGMGTILNFNEFQISWPIVFH